jgi:hypothetical protein
MDLFKPMSPSPEEMTLEEEIVHLADRFAEFASINAFICASMTSVMSADDSVPEDVLQGARRCSDAIRSRSLEMKVAMDQFRERYLNQKSNEQ